MKRPEDNHGLAEMPVSPVYERNVAAARPSRDGARSLEEWQTRYASRVMERAGWSQRGSIAVAKAAATLQCGEARTESWEAPEDAADEVMSSWEHPHG